LLSAKRSRFSCLGDPSVPQRDAAARYSRGSAADPSLLAATALGDALFPPARLGPQGRLPIAFPSSREMLSRDLSDNCPPKSWTTRLMIVGLVGRQAQTTKPRNAVRGFGLTLMGLRGVEPLTSRLSGVRSNQLSYRPHWSASRIPVPAGRAGNIHTGLGGAVAIRTAHPPEHANAPSGD
jgi:hypothetical protein